MLPAYVYCLEFGLVILQILYLATLIWKKNSDEKLKDLSIFLKGHPLTAMLIMGIIIAIPVGIFDVLLYEYMWIIAITPICVIFLLFPFILAVSKIRNKFLCNKTILKWLFFISTAAIVSSLLFMILTNCHLLSGTDESYLTRDLNNHGGIIFEGHPFDSLRTIWEFVPYVIAEIPFAFILYFLGKGFMKVKSALTNR